MKSAWSVKFDAATGEGRLMRSFTGRPCKFIVGGDEKRKEGRFPPCGVDINTGSWWGRGILVEWREDAVTQASPARFIWPTPRVIAFFNNSSGEGENIAQGIYGPEMKIDVGSSNSVLRILTGFFTYSIIKNKNVLCMIQRLL